MGKYQGTKPVNHHLHGRIALAAAVWHGLRDPAAAVLFVAADTHGASRTPDAAIVRAHLVERWRVPAERVHARRWADCTVVEVRAMRVLARAGGIRRVLAVTHGYHAPRAARYFDQVGLRVEVLVPETATLARFPLPPAAADLEPEMRDVVACGRPRRFDLLRERLVEAYVSVAHRLDPRGRLERALARRFRA
jgi:hypothetical protein